MNRKIKELASTDISSIKLSISSNTFKVIYYKNKDYILPLFIFFISIAVFFGFLMVQIQEFYTFKTEEDALKGRIIEYQNKLRLISNLDENKLKKDLNMTYLALPPEKDYAGILYGISRAGDLSGVTLSDYSFSVGDLSTKSAEVSPLPSISINFTVKANVDGTKKFIKSLYEAFPLATILSVSLNKDSANILTNFYYKASSYAAFDIGLPIKEITSEQNLVLEKISSWKTKSLSPE